MEELKQEDPLVGADTEIEDGEGECRMCKFVFVFALLGVFFVIVFTYFFKLHTPPAIEALPQEQVRPVSNEEWQTRVLELKRTVAGESPASSTSR